MYCDLSDDLILELKKTSMAMGEGWKLDTLYKNQTYIFNPITKEKISCCVNKKMWNFRTCLPLGYHGSFHNSIGCSVNKNPNVIARDIKSRLLDEKYIEEIEKAKIYFSKVKKDREDLSNIKNALSKVCEISKGYHHRFRNPLYFSCRNTSIEGVADLDTSGVTLKITSKVSIECLFEIIRLLDQDKYR